MNTTHPGIQRWKNPHGIAILRLHYSADPDKTPEWAAAEKSKMTDPAMAAQELEIDFHAREGQLVYQLVPEATLVRYADVFPKGVPHTWTRYFALDPHPRVPHAFLWCAVDPYGDRWYYRELWPSKICGKPGKPPEDDNRFKIKHYVETVRWLESADNPDNHGQREAIWKRVIDYSARAMGQGTTDDPEQDNFQQRYEKWMQDLVVDNPSFEDAKKDLGVGVERVNEGLLPLQVEVNGQWVQRSRIHICEDACPELVWELRNNRWKQLTPTQSEVQDPSPTPIAQRKHMTDNLRYIEMSNPEFIEQRPARDTFQPVFQGISY